MDAATPLGTSSAQRAPLITTLAVPLTGRTMHALTLHRKLAAARHDPLTGLLGRDGYTAKARQILNRYTDTATGLMCDLDHFKAFSDTLDHAVGDAVISATADRLSAWAGCRAAVGRLGGDEFALTLRIGPERRQARLAQLFDKLAQPVVLEDHESSRSPRRSAPPQPTPSAAQSVGPAARRRHYAVSGGTS
ncbi:GGDEF domain-containing protein [Streptomyces sp. NPDC102282]|uniref:GGDEF domain-containing protein n=1 Tax=Streptomyces sp. NPDC102282 TaxID=3366154 RepID=UPI00381F5184